MVSARLYFLPVPRLALSSLNKHNEAVGYYKKALELDPENEMYKSNLKIAEQKMKETPSPVSSPKRTSQAFTGNRLLKAVKFDRLEVFCLSDRWNGWR